VAIIKNNLVFKTPLSSNNILRYLNLTQAGYNIKGFVSQYSGFYTDNREVELMTIDLEYLLRKRDDY